MKYYRLGSLKDYIAKNFYNIKWNEKLKILRNIVAGLKHLHNQKIIHRDFHSGNILYENEFDIVISDLEISKSSIDNDDNEIYGVILYMAPEILQGNFTEILKIASTSIRRSFDVETMTSNPRRFDVVSM